MIGTIEQTCITGSRDHNLSAVTLDGVAIASDTFFFFQLDRATLPIGLQLSHSRALYPLNSLCGISGLKAQPQTATVLIVSGS